MRVLLKLVVGLGMVCFPICFSAAGSAEPLARILPGFFVEGITLPESPGHEAHFEDQGEAVASMAQLNATLASQFASFPIGSSSGAFTFGLDPETGAYVPTSDSFGPIFAERAETLGKGKVNFGVSTLFSSYDSLDGLSLEGGEIVFNLLHQDADDDTLLTPVFEGDVIRTNMFLSLQQTATVAFGTFGVTDNFDLGLAVPFVSVDLDATFSSTIVPLSTVGDGTHQFADGSLVQQNVVGGTANGLGDVLLRGKYNFRKGFAGGFDIRLPTGDEEELLGTGATQVRLLFIARGRRYDVFYGGLHPHLNLGYTISDGDYTLDFGDGTVLRTEPPDELNYAVGFDAALGPSITVAVDLIGRTLLDAPAISLQQRELLYTAPDDTVKSATFTEVVPNESDVSILLGTIGFKIKLVSQYLLTFSAQLPVIDDRGLEDDISGTVGLNFTF